MALFGPVQIVVIPQLQEIPISNTNPMRWHIIILVTILPVPLKIHMTGLGATLFVALKIKLRQLFSADFFTQIVPILNKFEGTIY